MGVKTIEELKSIWKNGFVPQETDYEDIFDTLESFSSEGSAFGKIYNLQLELDASELNFGGTNANQFILVPTESRKMILVHGYSFIWELTSSVEQDYAGVYFGYDLIASGYPEDIVQIPVNQIGRGYKNAIGTVIHKDYFGNDDESIINAPLVLRGEEGVGMSGIAGTLYVKIDYSFLDYPFPVRNAE